MTFRQKIVNNNKNIIKMKKGFKGTINLNGRPKGSVNKSTAEIRDYFKLLVEGNLTRLQSDLDSLKPTERIRFLIDLAKFVIPTLKAVEMQGEIKTAERQPIVFVKKG